MMLPPTSADHSPIGHPYPAYTQWLGLWLAALLLWALLPARASAQGVPAAVTEHRPDRLLLGLAPGVTSDMAAAEVAAFGWEVTRTWPDLALIEVTAQPQAAHAASPQAADLAAASQAQFAHSPLFRYVD